MIKEEHTIDSLLLGPLTKPLMVIPTELISYVSWDEYGFNIENSFVRSNGLWYLDQVTLRRE
ncbi:MAG TPA: hypothetical protein PLJ60_02160 [Chryseolinea sp.]|nr:hypothetical protein [Chryseolinea sp.]HPM29114.1 hypothetical protein [Chryseolinea sp.]